VSVNVREATAKDLQLVLAIYKAAGLASRGHLDVEEATAIFARIGNYPKYHVFVAEISKEVVGTFALLIMDNLANGGLPSGVVEDVAVLPAFQGQGVGKAMMHFAMDRCKSNGCYKMMLSSNEIRTEAHRFYEGLGFKRHGFSYRVDW
jgi:GNAT superfamily N-acetyltransferase